MSGMDGADNIIGNAGNDIITGGDGPDTLLGGRETEDVVGALRCTVTSILPDGGVGRFGLSARQTFQKNAFVDLSRLQGALDSRGQVNALFFSGATDPPQKLDAVLQSALHLEDVGLAVEPRDGILSVTSKVPSK